MLQVTFEHEYTLYARSEPCSAPQRGAADGVGVQLRGGHGDDEGRLLLHPGLAGGHVVVPQDVAQVLALLRNVCIVSRAAMINRFSKSRRRPLLGPSPG